MNNAVLLTFFAGVVGTLAGGLLGLKVNPDSSRSLSSLLAFSAGMMISMICFDLLPEALEEAEMPITVAGCALGVCLLLQFDRLFHHHGENHPDQLDDLHHHQHALTHSRQKNMMVLGMMMIGSVALHNFPEGMAVGSSTLHDLDSGIMMAVLLAMHNLPEGMGMIVPLRSGSLSRPKALLLTAMSGLPTLIGGIFGVLLGSISPVFIGFTLALAAGCMLYVTYYEILPQVTLMNQGRRPMLFQLAGFLLGFVLICSL